MGDIADIIQENLARALEAVPPLKQGNPTGICVNCGEEIDPRRLALVPYAMHCATCQELEERGKL